MNERAVILSAVPVSTARMPAMCSPVILLWPATRATAMPNGLTASRPHRR